MAKTQPKDALTASQQLELLTGFPWPYAGRPPRYDLSTWTVTDDWPDPVPVTLDEVGLFEHWFGDLFDELLGRLFLTGSNPVGSGIRLGYDLTTPAGEGS